MVGRDPRGETRSHDRHIDALCHIMDRQKLYNGVPADVVTERGALELSMEVADDGTSWTTGLVRATTSMDHRCR